MIARLTQLTRHFTAHASLPPSTTRAHSFTTSLHTMSLPSTMKALQIQTQGGPEVLEFREIPVPKPSQNEVLIKTAYAGVNFKDNYDRGGLYKLPMPHVLGLEAAGIVVAVGDGVQDIKSGDKVACYIGGGAYAEYTKAGREKVIKLPSSVSLKDGAVSLLQGLTAWTLLREAYPVKKGDHILVHAAAGGTGSLLVQMGKHLGAHVIGTCSTDEKAAIAKEAGADDVVVYSKENLVDRVSEITGGKGVQGIYDGVGKDTWEDDFQLIARKGTIVTFGNASGAVPPFAPLKLAAKNVKVIRPVLNNYVVTQEEFETYAGELFHLIEKGQVKTKVHKEYPFSVEGIRQSQEDISSRGTAGKLVVKVAGEEA